MSFKCLQTAPGSARPTGKKRHTEQLLPPCGILARRKQGFHLFPEAIWNRRCKAAQMAISSFKRLLVRIWPTMAVFKCDQEANSLAGQRLAKLPNSYA